MKRSKSWLIIGAALACIGCCAVPIYLLVTGLSLAGAMAVIGSSTLLEVLLCLLPLLVIGWFYYRQSQAKNCCPNPQKQCNSDQCSREDGNKNPAG